LEQLDRVITSKRAGGDPQCLNTAVAASPKFPSKNINHLTHHWHRRIHHHPVANTTPSPMSAYKGHRGPNVSQYIANLNQLSPPQGFLDEPAPSEEDFSSFLNAEFLDAPDGSIADFDPTLNFDVNAAVVEQPIQPSVGQNSRKHSLHASAEPNMEFNLTGKRISSLFLSLLRCFRGCSQRT
jgi:hypothetical protein